MTHTTRHVAALKQNLTELFDKLSSFVSLIVMSSVEALFLYVFTRVHAQVHDILDHSPICPMKIAVIVMGASLLLLNVVIVVSFVATEIRKTIRQWIESAESNGSDDQKPPQLPNENAEGMSPGVNSSKANTTAANVGVTFSLTDGSHHEITLSAYLFSSDANQKLASIPNQK
ncbi:MAG TPA: hypothetical protein VLL54_13940 [Pyrinomonadaceae bacterium]|nr:hypothetical protein [Pyrinomonadaceae bacterium]